MLKAAICFSRGGDIPRAVELFVACGERGRGVELLRSVGDMVNAARLLTGGLPSRSGGRSPA